MYAPCEQGLLLHLHLCDLFLPAFLEMHEKCSKQRVVLVVLLFLNGIANAGSSRVFCCKFFSPQNMQKRIAKRAWLGVKIAT